MGAEPYQYFVDYEQDIQGALDKLRDEVFKSGKFNGAQLNPSTPEEALEKAVGEGTRSILDIMTISEQPEFCAAAPLSPEERRVIFGTEKPTAKTIEQSDEFWENLERGMARYVIIYEGDVPKKIFFAGYSFD